MVKAMTKPMAKQAAAVPARVAPSRSTANGINGSSAVITRHANKAHSAVDTRSSERIWGDAQV